MDDVAKNLKVLRENQLQMKAGEFAEKIGYTEEDVLQWENGAKIPFGAILKIENKFNVNISKPEPTGVIEEAPERTHNTDTRTRNKIILGVIGIIILCIVGYYLLPHEKGPTAAEYTKQIRDDYVLRMDKYKKMHEADNIKGSGNRFVTADRLNLRQSPSLEQKPLGEILLNAQVNVIETADPEWYKIEIPLKTYQMQKQGNSVTYKNAAGVTVVESSKPLSSGTFYVAARYLQDKPVSVGAIPNNPQKPFVYGLLFYNDQLAQLLSTSIWTQMADNLKALGYDGIKVVRQGLKDEKAKQELADGRLDALETSPEYLYQSNKNGEIMDAYAKLSYKNNAESHDYTGFIIVNKDSGINSIKDLKGKTIFTGKETSASSYLLQLDALKEKGFNVNDFHLKTGMSHHQLLRLIADKVPVDGVIADAAFVGDFIMTSAGASEFDYITQFGLDRFKNNAELESARDKIWILPIDIAKIPSNPHVLRPVLYKNESFRNELRSVVSKVYADHNQLYGITDANNDEYKNMGSFDL